MYKAIGLICLIVMSVSAEMNTVKLSSAPFNHEKISSLKIETAATTPQNSGVEFLDGFAFGLSPTAYNDIKVWINNIQLFVYLRDLNYFIFFELII